ncbi:MAG: SH3 domain-containing protein [Pleurocapsa minor GSE-CHR-MK-17-07R]|nr:SH3 domain-containing protein [Pleurocapsa minor GSE-CHR-MK 17-07R]
MKTRTIRIQVVILLVLALLSTSVFMAQADFGTGWTAEYFANANLQPPAVFQQGEPNGVNLNWGFGSPNPAVPIDNFSARFTSTQIFNQGTYEFVVTSDDGIRVFIDNVLVLDKFIGRPQTTDRFQIALTAGAHNLVVEYFESIDTALVQVQWFQIAGATPTAIIGGGGTVATPFGTPPPTVVYTGPLATVSGVRGLALRTGPYVGASFITTLPGETSYPVLARNIDEGVYNWYLLRVGERTGWASGRFLQVSVPPEALPLQGSIFDQINDVPERNATAITRAVMRLRSRPSDRVPVLAELPWGAVVPILGRTVQAGTNRWYQVRYEGQIGWIAAPWVTAQGEIFSVPIR